MAGNAGLRQSTVLDLKAKKRRRDSGCDKPGTRRGENEKRKRDGRERCGEAKA